ncbi:MAG: hypothetical protein ACI9DM_002915, partial [Cyclobacteriaceae bacterium]
FWLTGEVYKVQSCFDSALCYFKMGVMEAANQGHHRSSWRLVIASFFKKLVSLKIISIR